MLKKFLKLKCVFFCLLILMASCSKSIDYRLIKTQFEQKNCIPVFLIVSPFLQNKIPLEWGQNYLNLFIDSFQQSFPNLKLDGKHFNHALLRSDKDYRFTEMPNQYLYSDPSFSLKTLITKGNGYQIHQKYSAEMGKPLIMLFKISSTGHFKVYGHDKDNTDEMNRFTLFFSCEMIDTSSQKLLADFPLAEISFSTEELLVYTNHSFSLMQILNFPDIVENLKQQVRSQTHLLIQNISGNPDLK